jgi:hypothetical protein
VVVGKVVEEEEAIRCQKKKEKDQMLVFFGLADTI